MRGATKTTTTVSERASEAATTALTPSTTMSHVYGPRHVYAPRAHAATSTWLTTDAALLDSLTANQLTIAGDMPVVCSAGCATPPGLDLIAEAGVAVAPHLHTFRDEREVIDLLAGLAMSGHKVVVQHAYPPGVLPASAFWAAAPLLPYLNNKANLGELAASRYVPRRRVTTPADLDASSLTLPAFLKVATDDSTGGGGAVAACRMPADAAAALARFARGSRLVVEECLDVARTPCLNFAVMPDGDVRYLGFADQDVTDDGRYKGNWLTPGGPALSGDVVAPAFDAVRRGAALGYRGIAGVDLAITPDGRPYVIDLNFRVNGSTAAVLLAPSVERRVGRGAVVHVRGFVGTGDFATLMAVARAAVRRGRFIPVATFDPVAAGRGGTAPRVGGMVVGDSVDDIRSAEAELWAQGMC